MANFGKLSLTRAGINTLVKAQAGSEIAFTKIKMGSGINSGDVSNLTELVEPQLSAEIVSGALLDNTYTVEAHFTNEGLEKGFYWREIGLYVNDGFGGDVLFGYANAGASSDYIPATASEIYTKHIRISVAVGDAQNITVHHSSNTYVDVITFDEAMGNKVDKEEGKGLSSNDYTDADKDKLATLEKDLEDFQSSVNQSINSLNDKFNSYATTQDLEEAIEEFNTSISQAVNEINDSIEAVHVELNSINKSIGDSNISSIGDGSVKGAILKLYQMISAIPAISSGTSEPTGGKDGDVYIMHE